MLLKEVEKKYLVPLKVTSLYEKRSKNSIAEIVKHLLVHKYKFKVKYMNV